jgi:hypothetical protein
MDKLIQKLAKYGSIQIIKEGVVFTLLMTGTGLANAKTVNAIQMAVLSHAGNKYPYIEAMKNSDTYFCLILKS